MVITYPEAPKVAVAENDISQTSDIVLLQGNTLLANNFYVPKPQILATHIDYFYLLDQYDWDSNLMYRIMLCESSGNPNAHNFSHRTRDDSWGLLQVNRYGALANIRPSAEWLKIPANNIEYAYSIWERQGYNAWRNCYRQNR